MRRRAFITGSLVLAIAGLEGERCFATPEPQRLPSDLVAELSRLKGEIVLGSARPDITVYEFFDYNCAYCRASAPDIRPLLSSDRKLSYVLVNYAVLSEASIFAARVALAFSQQKPQGYLAFHEAMFKRRGVNGAEQAIDTAFGLGADKARLVKDADSDAVTQNLIAAAKLGERLGLAATPSYVIGGESLVGYVDRAAMKSAIANQRACEKLSC